MSQLEQPNNSRFLRISLSEKWPDLTWLSLQVRTNSWESSGSRTVRGCRETFTESFGLHSLLEKEQLGISRIQIKSTGYPEVKYSKRRKEGNQKPLYDVI